MEALWTTLWTPVWTLLAAPLPGLRVHAQRAARWWWSWASPRRCCRVCSWCAARRLMGDAISHSVLLGVVLGWMLGRQAGIFWGALASGILSGIAITYVERNSRVKLDAAMGVFFTFAFALGLASHQHGASHRLRSLPRPVRQRARRWPRGARADRAVRRPGARHAVPLLPRLSSLELRRGRWRGPRASPPVSCTTCSPPCSRPPSWHPLQAVRAHPRGGDAGDAGRHRLSPVRTVSAR